MAKSNSLPNSPNNGPRIPFVRSSTIGTTTSRMRFMPFSSTSRNSQSSSSSSHYQSNSQSNNNIVHHQTLTHSNSYPETNSSKPLPSADFTFQSKSQQKQSINGQPSQHSTSQLNPQLQVLSILHNHIYCEGFLNGKGSDINLIIPKWRRSYSCHKIILMQSSFFNSLFEGPFSENGSNNQDITLGFDDPNITRSSFEYCLAYLYGNGPHLSLDPKLTPSPTYPLTPSYPSFDISTIPSKDKQLATPEFCVSLVATSIYLGCPSITNKALSFILASISPINVSFYLRFALGEGLGSKRIWYPGEQEPCIGMEDLGKLIEKPLETHHELTESEISHDNTTERFSNIDIGSPNTNDQHSSFESDSSNYNPSFHYGSASDKVGEACVCWISRWAIDMLEIEDLTVNEQGDITHPSKTLPFAVWSIDGIPAKWIRAVISSDSLFAPGGEWQRYKIASRIVELRRRQNKGELLYSDECEFDRMFSEGIYYSHLTFEQLSYIQRDISQSTGRPYVPIRILQQALWTHSELQNLIENSVTNQENTNEKKPDLGLVMNSWDIRDKVRGSKDSKFWSERRFFPVFKDSTERLGDASSMYQSVDELNKYVPPTFNNSRSRDESDASGLAASTHDPLGSNKVENNNSQNNSSAYRRPMTENQLFGLMKSHKTGWEICKMVENEIDNNETKSISSQSSTAKRSKEDKWTVIEPLRFSVEYWIKSELEPREKKFSHAVFYAGSYINTYIQVNEQKHKNGNQLGIYVHRQSMHEPLPYASSPPNSSSNSGIPLSPAPTMDTILRVNSAGSEDSTGSNNNNNSNHNVNDSAKVGPGIHSGSQNMPPAPYKDPRKTLRAFFAVQCSSGNGTAVTKFTSAPDNFTTSQSWGWKSSVQRSAEYLANHDVSDRDQLGVLNSLRAVVTMGII